MAPAGPLTRHREVNLRGLKESLICALAIACVGALPVAMYQGHRAMVRVLARSLSRGVGLPVTVGDMWVTLGRTVILDRISVGDHSFSISIRRVEIEMESPWDRREAGTLLRVRRVQLLRPVLRITREGWQRWAGVLHRHWDLAAAATSRDAGDKDAQGAGQRRVQVVVESGDLDLEIPVQGHDLAVRGRGLFIGPAPRGRRLLLGQTTLSLDGRRILEASSTAADLQPEQGYWPSRVVVAGGMLGLPGLPGPLVRIHLLRLRRRPWGYRLLVQGRMASQAGGEVSASVKLDPAFRPSGARAIELILRQADLSPLASLLGPLGLHTAGATLSGTVHASRLGPRVHLTTRLHARGMVLQHHLVGRQKVGPFDPRVAGELSLDLGRRRIELNALALSARSLELHLQGVLAAPAGRHIALVELSLPRTPCQEVLESLPPGFAPALRGLVLEGEMSLRALLSLDTADLDGAGVDLTLSPMSCRVISDPPGADVNKLGKVFSITVPAADGKTLALTLGPGNPTFVPLGRLPIHLPAAFVAAEDSHFYQHRGFDPTQIRRAFIEDLKAGRPVRGASTISQQLVKNVFLHHRRDLSRKFQEAVLTWRMEQRVSKRRILELYLNLVEMGPGIYGVGHAASSYFNRSAQRLTRLQAAQLAALTPSPRRLSRQLRNGRPSQEWIRRLQVVLRLMERRGRSQGPRS